MSNSKMPFAYTIRGSASMCASNFGPGTVCERCYAKRLENLRPNLKAYNLQQEIKNLRSLYQAHHYHLEKFTMDGGKYVRVWDFGDFSTQEQVDDLAHLARDIRVMSNRLKFWVPTKAYGLDFSKLYKEPNITVRMSMPDIDSEPSKVLKPQSVVVRKPEEYKKTYGGFICPGSCEKDNCRACWDKRKKLIIYKAR